MNKDIEELKKRVERLEDLFGSLIGWAKHTGELSEAIAHLNESEYEYLEELGE